MRPAGTVSRAILLFSRSTGKATGVVVKMLSGTMSLIALALLGVILLVQAQSDNGKDKEEAAVKGAEFFPVDLSRFVTTAFSNVPSGNTWAALPRGKQSFQGVPFDISGKFEVTGLYVLHSLGHFFPSKVTGIPVGRKAERIVLLHGTGWTELDGTPMAKMVLHYASGREEALRIVYGLHVRNWYEDRSDSRKTLSDPNSALVWNGSDEDSDRGTPFRLYKTAFENPFPDEVIQSIDFVSLFSQAAPIIVGLTLQNKGAPLAKVDGPLRRLVKKSLEQPDGSYTRSIAVRAVEADSAKALTNATLWVTLTDDQGSYFFGAFAADPKGMLSFDYPPRETISLNLLVKSPNRGPFSLSPAREKNGHFPRELTAGLGPGVTIGGIVQDDGGKPVENAEILVSSIARARSKVYTQIDFDKIRSDKAGRWQSSSLPRGFSNLVLQVDHPEFRAASFQEPGTNTLTRSNIVTGEDLLAQKSVLRLRRGFFVQGIVKEGTNRPLANAEVHFFEILNSPKAKRKMRTGPDGRFSFVSTAESGEAALAIVANGFAPKYEAFFVESATNPFEFQMGKGSRLQARVIDNEQKPVVGATVKVEQWHNTQIVNFRSVTDTNGIFTWDEAPEGSITLSFSKTNFFTMRAGMALSGNTASGSMTTYSMRRMSAASGLVLDGDTKKPIEEFTIIKGHSYSPGEPIRWNRYSGSMTKGRNGRYNVRLDDYYNGQSKIMIEAPGYIPVMSPAYSKAGWYTNDFLMKKGTGFAGTVLLPSGEPAANCSVVMVDPGAAAYMDQPGDFRMNMSGYEHVRTDLQGKFKFPPKAEAQTLLAAHDKGFVQVQTDQLPADGKLKLEPWGHLKGVIKVGKVEPGQMATLQSTYRRYGEENGRRSPAISLYLKTPLDANGNFQFDKVPPGDRTAYLQHEFRTSRGGYPLSHGVPVDIKSGETNTVSIGGTGRTLLGKIRVVNGEATDVDWRRDLHNLSLQLPDNPENQPVVMPSMNSEEERQKFWEERNKKIKEFWQTEKGKEMERKLRNYVLIFDTNGNFRVDNLPPGTYNLSVYPTDPIDDDGSYRQLGSMSKQITVPEGPADQPFDSGSHDLTIRRQLRVGQTAPSLEIKTLDGKTVKLADYKGKYVLIDFCAKWSGGYTTQIANLKSLHDTFSKTGGLEIISLSVDYDEKQARDMMTELKVPWTFCYLGQWGQTQIPAQFGVEGIPHAILITPDGKIAGKNLQGTYMKNTVRRAVESKTVTTTGAIRG